MRLGTFTHVLKEIVENKEVGGVQGWFWGGGKCMVHGWSRGFCIGRSRGPNCFLWHVTVESNWLGMVSCVFLLGYFLMSVKRTWQMRYC